MLIGINHGSEVFEDRFDGKDYIFEPGKKVAIPEAAATHIFGYGVSDKLPSLIRLGWVRNSGELKAGLAKLGDFEFNVAAPSPDLAALEAPGDMVPIEADLAASADADATTA